MRGNRKPRARRCPKCGCPPIGFTEYWKDHRIAFDAKPDGAPEDVGELLDGRPYSVFGTCICGHHWRLRGVMQITELAEPRAGS